MTNYIHTVHYYETDKMGITHHSNYIRWMEEARVAFLDEIGWPYRKLEEVGLVSPVMEVNAKYLRPTEFGDKISVCVEIRELKLSKMKIGYTMKKEDGTLVAEGESMHAFLLSSGRPALLKKDFSGLYEALLAHVAAEDVK